MLIPKNTLSWKNLRSRYGRYCIFNRTTCELDITLLINSNVTAVNYSMWINK